MQYINNSMINPVFSTGAENKGAVQALLIDSWGGLMAHSRGNGTPNSYLWVMSDQNQIWHAYIKFLMVINCIGQYITMHL